MCWRDFAFDILEFFRGGAGRFDNVAVTATRGATKRSAVDDGGAVKVRSRVSSIVVSHLVRQADRVCRLLFASCRVCAVVFPFLVLLQSRPRCCALSSPYVLIFCM